ncbi:hypothetical protein Dda_4937 [Drechslerella dactyloides]|uniref:Glycosyltransferase family 8 protein n=1 Tax=Drechslerella dactyloides TaxID=74499 RepID=A0AAD6NL34_DREDA|nr:hypothetical protein Dda_4937 [Drechslerella dactyloides]
MKGRIGLRLTSSVLFIFSLILFLSGCVLQRQSMHTLERYYDQIPLPDTHPLTLNKNHRNPKPPPSSKNGRPNSKRPRYGDQQRLMSSTSKEYNSWEEVERAQAEKRMAERLRKVGYVQMVQTLDEVCGAVMAFGDLDRLGSRAARVLVYPESWDMQLEDPSVGATTSTSLRADKEGVKKESRKLSSWRRRDKAKRSQRTTVQDVNVNVEINPPPMTRASSMAAKQHFHTARRLLFHAQERYHAQLIPLPETAISAVTVFNMTSYNRLLYLSHPAQVLKNMDDLLLYTPPAPLAAPRRTSSISGTPLSVSPNFLLITPSATEYRHLTRQLGTSKRATKSQIATVLEDTYAAAGVSIVLPRAPFEFHTSEFFLPPPPSQSHTGSRYASWTADRVQGEGYYIHFDGRKVVTVDGEKTWVPVPQPWKTASLEDGVAPQCAVVADEGVVAAEGDGEKTAGAKWDCSTRDAWRAVYREYRQRRMEVCGLDLEV